MKTRLILASQSVGRKKLLEYLKVPFEVVPSTLDEDKIIASTPIETIRLRARAKGEDVAYRIQNSVVSNQKKSKSRYVLTTDNRQLITIILSADSGAILDGKLIGKPKDEKDAYRIFRLLSGRTHEFVTATFIISLSQQLSTGLNPKSYKILLDDVDRSYVTFRKITDEDIKLYLKLTDYTKFAGGYAVSSAQNFITKIEGSISSVIGLPLEKVVPVFRKYQVL